MESMYKQLATINVDSSVSALLPLVALTSIAAFRKTPLQKNVHELPLGKYIIGDNAYICSENLLTPFSGKY
jgi:hypothetical protein